MASHWASWLGPLVRSPFRLSPGRGPLSLLLGLVSGVQPINQDESHESPERSALGGGGVLKSGPEVGPEMYVQRRFRLTHAANIARYVNT